jgi:hypothetical protein
MFVVRHIGGDDPKVVITDPKYYMICVVTYITEHEQGGTGLVIGIRFDDLADLDG